MELNADFSQRIVMHSEQLEWQDSPMPGVRRRMLDRLGDEVARATTIVSYAPGSQFSPHVHTGGEEFVVLEGIFQDEHGDFPAGSYIRNPPESSHTPGSEPGCVIFVKLWQFDLADRTEARINMNTQELLQNPNQAGVQSALLHQDERETVTIQSWKPDAAVNIEAAGGAELLVLNGTVLEREDQLGKYSWLRVPPGSSSKAKAGRTGARVWIKSGHLNFVKRPA